MQIKASKVTLVFKEGGETVKALSTVSLQLPEKGIVGILGPSGSGKTSLLYVLAGMRKPTEGMVSYDDKPHVGFRGSNMLRRKEMGFVFQFHFLINYLTVLENVLVGSVKPDSQNRLKAEKILEKLGLMGLEKRHPSQLSGGQRQRVAIARAMANNPKVIFVDEPTASLDLENSHKVMDLLKEVALTACVVLVTHDESILQGAVAVHRLRDGKMQP